MAAGSIRIHNYLKRDLGSCPACMRLALGAGVAAWALLGVAPYGGLAGAPLWLLGIAALALTALWLAHVAAFAVREAAPIAGDAGGEFVDRRHFLGVMLKATGAGVAASVPIMLWPSAARAFCGQCSKNSDCGVGWRCANTAGPNQPVCMECVQ